jgi:hypothetical protein
MNRVASHNELAKKTIVFSGGPASHLFLAFFLLYGIKNVQLAVRPQRSSPWLRLKTRAYKPCRSRPPLHAPARRGQCMPTKRTRREARDRPRLTRLLAGKGISKLQTD